MFESASLGRSYSTKEYDALKDDLRGRLFAAQREAREYDVPALVIIEGVDGVGKDAVVNLLSAWMDYGCGCFWHPQPYLLAGNR